MSESCVFPALNTIQAKWWEIRLAMLFGDKSTAKDSGCTVTLSKWRGKYYLIDCKHDVGTQPEAPSEAEHE